MRLRVSFGNFRFKHGDDVCPPPQPRLAECRVPVDALVVHGRASAKLEQERHHLGV